MVKGKKSNFGSKHFLSFFFSFLRINFKFVPYDQKFVRLDWIAEPENKFTTLEIHNMIRVVSNYRSGTSSVLHLKEKSLTFFAAFCFVRFSPFYELFNELMSNLAAGGIYDFLYESILNPLGSKLKIDEIGPQVLTMEHLMIGFQVCSVLLIFSTIVFGLEIALKYYEKFMPNIRKMLELWKPKRQIFEAKREKKRKIQSKKDKTRKFL